MSSLQKTARTLYQAYVGVGIAAMAFVSVSVIITVIMRYFFNISFTFLEELITVVFAFSTFWGIGICALEDEHVIIDFFFVKLPEKVQRWVSVFNYAVVLVTMLVLQYFTINWIAVAGKTISNGLRIKYIYIYGVMPIGVAISSVCVLVKLICLITGKKLNLKPKEAEVNTEW